MGIIIDFLNNWQNLIGSLIGALIAIIGAVLINLYLRNQERISEQKREFSNLLLVLHDIQLFITRCETYLGFRNKSTVSFNKIVLNDRLNYIESSQTFNLNPEVYNSIQKIYNVANVIKNNIEKSEVVEIHKKKDKDKNEVLVQRSIISDRYWNAVSFAEHYLEDIYANFNFIAKEIKKISKEYKHLSFPNTIKLYTRDYIKQKIKEYNLKSGRL